MLGQFFEHAAFDSPGGVELGTARHLLGASDQCVLDQQDSEEDGGEVEAV